MAIGKGVGYVFRTFGRAVKRSSDDIARGVLKPSVEKSTFLSSKRVVLIDHWAESGLIPKGLVDRINQEGKAMINKSLFRFNGFGSCIPTVALDKSTNNIFVHLKGYTPSRSSMYGDIVPCRAFEKFSIYDSKGALLEDVLKTRKGIRHTIKKQTAQGAKTQIAQYNAGSLDVPSQVWKLDIKNKDGNFIFPKEIKCEHVINSWGNFWGGRKPEIIKTISARKNPYTNKLDLSTKVEDFIKNRQYYLREGKCVEGSVELLNAQA